MNVCQALTSKKSFLSPRGESNPQPYDDRWDVVTIELPRLRKWAKEQVRHICDLSGSHYMLMLIILLMRYICKKCRSWEISWMMDERSSNFYLRKTISKLQHFQHIYRINNIIDIINISWLTLRSHICRTCTLAYYLSLGSSMVTASLRSSEGWGFNSRLGLRNRFPEVRTWQTLICHSGYLQVPTFPTYIQSNLY